MSLVEVARGIGVTPPAAVETTEPAYSAPEVSVENTPHNSIKTRQVAILVADGFAGDQVDHLKQQLASEGATARIVGNTLNPVPDAQGNTVVPEKNLKTGPSVLFDAVYVPGGAAAIEALRGSGDAIHFIQEAFKHAKPIGATGEGVDLLRAANLGDIDLANGADVVEDRGVVTALASAGFDEAFIAAIKQHRFFIGRAIDAIPA